MTVRDRFSWIRHSAHRDAVSQRGKAFFLKGDRSPRFWITNFLGRHDSAVLKNELEIQDGRVVSPKLHNRRVEEAAPSWPVIEAITRPRDSSSLGTVASASRQPRRASLALLNSTACC